MYKHRISSKTLANKKINKLQKPKIIKRGKGGMLCDHNNHKYICPLDRAESVKHFFVHRKNESGKIEEIESQHDGILYNYNIDSDGFNIAILGKSPEKSKYVYKMLLTLLDDMMKKENRDK